MSIIQAIKRVFVRGPVFEALQNEAGEWFVHKLGANGEIVNHTEAYSNKSNAVRSAKRQAAETKNATWRIKA